ncbi:hypothetical protein ACFQ0E_03015 [Lysobacter brunescens]|uniref:Uncharacterized protein n=2 Tax=Lysobacter brunescens TaxID=262323 RepID=A0ABW2Y8Y4_9GAMM
MMGSQVVQELEEAFLPRLDAAKEMLEREFPSFHFNVWSSSTGGLTSYQGHDVGLECLFPGTPDELADNVAIIIGVKHLTTAPLLCDASVGWGHGSAPGIHIDLLPNPVAFSTAELNAVSARFGLLISVFRSALIAGPGKSDA